MKNLFLFILCAVFCVSSAFGQMIVRGDIKVSTATGYIKAKTPVILKDSASTSYPRGVIYNAGTLNLQDSLIFCSNAQTDGMIVPMSGTSNNKVETAEGDTVIVAVRKDFSQLKDEWIPVSFPFNVSVAALLDANRSLVYTDNEADADDVWNFAIVKYNSQTRADYGLPTGKQDTPENWDYVATHDTLFTGQGYRVIVTDPADVIVYFPSADNAATNTALLGYGDKNTTEGLVKYWKRIMGTANETYNAGWNYIGGLNPCAFDLSAEVNFTWGNTDEWNGLIYYLDENSVWDELTPGTSNITLSPFTGFFVQMGDEDAEDYSFSFNTSGLSSKSAYPVDFRSAQPQRQVLHLNLSNQAKQSSDRLLIYLGDQYKEEVDIREDGQKLLVSNDPRTRLWSLQGTFPLVINALPPKDGREIPVGFSAPEAGSYVFTLEDRSGSMKSVELLDKLTGKTVNLSKPYTFDLSQPGSTSDRFVLLLNRSITNIVPVDAGGIYAYITDSRLTVRNLQAGERVQLTDLSGRLIASGISQGETYSLPVPGKGVYVVCVKGDRNTVLKVLNQ